MTLYQEIKKFVGKIIDNPIKTAVAAFLIWRILKSESKENICEGFKVISKKDDKELIFDGEYYHVVKNGRDISSFKDKNKAMKLMEGVNMNINTRIEALRKPDGTGPHGRGLGPGKGKADGSGLEEVKLKGGDVPDEKFDAKELAKGIKVEKEHTDDLEVAKQIAKAHLLEDKDYYVKLAKYVESIDGRIDMLKESLKEGDKFDLWDNEAQNMYGKSYDDLTSSQKKDVRVHSKNLESLKEGDKSWMIKRPVLDSNLNEKEEREFLGYIKFKKKFTFEDWNKLPKSEKQKVMDEWKKSKSKKESFSEAFKEGVSAKKIFDELTRDLLKLTDNKDSRVKIRRQSKDFIEGSINEWYGNKIKSAKSIVSKYKAKYKGVYISATPMAWEWLLVVVNTEEAK